MLLAAAAGTAAAAGPATGQSLLDRSPNLSGDWVARTGVVQFNFLHRFVRSPAPERKVTNFPTFEVGVGLPRRLMLGFHYSTNSTLASRYPNEWEFFLRHGILQQDAGAPLDLAGQVGYNLSAEGVDGEVSAARRLGPLRLILAGRVLSDPYVKGEVRAGAGGGFSLQLLRHLAIGADVASVMDRNQARGERIAWSVGVQVAIPNTPHTLSLQATNTNTTTLQGLSVGGDQRRYGFEFTIPITLARFFGRTPPPPATSQPAASTPSAVVPAGGKLVVAGIRGMGFAPARLEIEAGTTITWKNDDPLAHSVTAADGSFDSGLIPPGGSWSHIFSAAGSYDFSCTPHPFMKGTVIVRAAP